MIFSLSVAFGRSSWILPVIPYHPYAIHVDGIWRLLAGITRGHPRVRRACGYRDARPARDPRPPETISASRPETSSCVHALSVVRDRPDCHPACDVQRIGGHQASLFAGEPAVIGFTRFAQCRLFVTQLPRFRAMRSDRGCRDFVPLLLSWHSLVMALFRLPPSPTRTEANDRKRNDRGKRGPHFFRLRQPA